VDLDPDDVADYMDSAIGFGGYATNGQWLVTFSYSNLELEDSDRANGIKTTYDLDLIDGEILLGRPVSSSTDFSLNLEGGLRYFNRKFRTRFDDGINPVLSNKRDDSWTDVVLGVTADWRFTPKWAWNNHLDASFGDSEGTSTFKSALNWSFAQNWSASFFGKAAAIELESGDEGDADYLVYDVDETSFGASFLYHF